jgi:hypothetical protein
VAQAVDTSALGHELPQAERTRARQRVRIVGRLDHRDVEQVLRQAVLAQVARDQILVATLIDEPARDDVLAARIGLVEDQVVDELLRPPHRQVGKLEVVEPRMIGPQLARLLHHARLALEARPRRRALVDPRARIGARKQLDLDLAELVARARAGLADRAAADSPAAIELLRQRWRWIGDRWCGLGPRVQRFVRTRCPKTPQQRGENEGGSTDDAHRLNIGAGVGLNQVFMPRFCNPTAEDDRGRRRGVDANRC